MTIRFHPILWIALAVLPLVPAIAMFAGTEGVAWTARDFVFAALMLAALGLGIEVVVSGFTGARRYLGFAVLIATFLLTWGLAATL